MDPISGILLLAFCVGAALLMSGCNSEKSEESEKSKDPFPLPTIQPITEHKTEDSNEQLGNAGSDSPLNSLLQLECTRCPGVFRGLEGVDPNGNLIQGEKGTFADHTNFTFFTICDYFASPQECVPVIEENKWFGVDPSQSSEGNPGLTKDNSYMICTVGKGIIYPVDSGQVEGDLDRLIKDVETVDYLALAIMYGENTYATRDEILKADLIDLFARVIFTEQTQTKDKGQEAVTWSIANRVLAQEKSAYSLDNKSSNLFNIIAKEKQYSCLDVENGNTRCYTRKVENDTEWDSWVHAVMLSEQTVSFFERNYEEISLPKEEIDELRQELASDIGPSPIGNLCSFRGHEAYENDYNAAEGTFSGYKVTTPMNVNGNWFFDYITEN